MTIQCIQCNTKQPYFNYPNEKIAIYCSKCKLDGMVNIKDKKCIKCNNITPGFNYPNEKSPAYCNECKLDGMIDIKTPRFICKSCNLEWYVTKKSKELCSYCDPNTMKKSKELQVKKLLERNKIEFINDKTISNTCCYKYRPDFLIDCISYFIVIEVDENAHKQYDKDCELIRMNNISYSLGLPVKFIRYNPDNKIYTKSHKEHMLIQELLKYSNLDYLENLETVYLFY